jgi:hypothetical protein
MNTALTEAIKEAYASAPTGVVYLETLQISHPLVVEDIFLVNDRVNHAMTLETAVVKNFRACSFRMALPASGDTGLQELSLTIDNVGREISDFMTTVRDSLDPVVITYRPYLSTDLTTPQMDPPLVLNLTDVVVTAAEVSGRATFADIINRKFPTDFYTRSRFPGLAS